MDKYGYTLHKRAEKKEAGHYRKEELQLMTTYQLKEICRMEKLVQGGLRPMEKEELIRIILRYRGADENLLIRTADSKGTEALERFLGSCILEEQSFPGMEGSSKIVAYEGLAIHFYDRLEIPYKKELAETNALVVSGGKICGILNVKAKGKNTDKLYLTKAAVLPCREAETKNYSLYLMERKNSELLYRIYSGGYGQVPGHLEVYKIPLLDFEVLEPADLLIPLAIDFGTSNTAAGAYLDRQYLERVHIHDGEYGLKENEVNYALFYDTASDWEETTLFPSVAGVLSAETGKTEFVFGYEAVRLADSSYIDEGFCIFYDIKRWISDYNKLEEITDSQGRRSFVSRKEILKAYLIYVIQEACNRLKCKAEKVHISCPVKQKARFAALFAEILPDYALEKQDMLDESVSVLYGTISDMIGSGQAEEGREYGALLMDCGGGTTDLCSCRFRIWDKRVAYRIEIKTAYENGDTDFGGNNLTYRVMQFMKIRITNSLRGKSGAEKEILDWFDTDIYRYVDETGADGLYGKLEEAYKEAEKYLPTRFREYENKGRADYYKVKNNFYALFQLAERVKKEFYSHAGTLKITLSEMPVILPGASPSASPIEENGNVRIAVDRFKLSADMGKGLETIKKFEPVVFSIYEMELLLTGDIYSIIKKFMEGMYESGRAEEYSIIKMTGQSCKIGLFRNALKEFIPGRGIQSKRRNEDRAKDLSLKMPCVEGALKYLRDKKYGLADILIQAEEPALPYNITAYTHSGEEIILIQGQERGRKSGMVSRNMENLVLKLYLKDLEGRERYQYTCCSALKDFEEMEYEKIEQEYGLHIRQEDTDDIVDREVRFFVWTLPEEWAFCVVPVYRKNERLFLGKQEILDLENDGWVLNFFDGMK